MDSSQVRILLVEDDPDDYYLTKDLLGEIPGSKIALEWARDFESGLASLHRCEHDVYLLDYRLGAGDGLDLLREGLRCGCKAPIILLTGQQDRDLALQALEAGAADYLVKGQIDAAGLERAIRYALQQKQQESDLEAKVAARTSELEKINAALRESETALREGEARIRALFETAEAARVSAEAAKARAESATRAKDDFLAALSHELRTPLSPALLLATSLADDATLPARARQDIDVIAKGIALQAQLVDDLLDITRISGGKLRLDLRPIDAHAALQNAYEIVRADATERKLSFTLDLAAQRNCIMADAVRVQQIFWNVLKNAVKFTPPGGAVSVRTGNPNSETLKVEITDTGVGIEPEMIGKVFDAFIQEEHDSAHRFGGIGLGLAISRRLVELQEGRITVRSDGRDCGSTFCIELPLAAEQVCADNAAPAPRRSVPAHVARRILLVEDHEETRAALSRLLERRGHSVICTATAAAALESAAAQSFDLVISDLGLPDLDGHALMAQLRALHGLTGIALSGYGMDEDLNRSRESGFFAHLTKPIDIHALETTIARAPV
ncbi:MAG: response regulator, partial [Verrucomicrobiota bacterium]|nr:response regulator [Verrucomicrobiota bacterium]